MHWRIQQWWYNALHHPLLWYNALSGHGQLVIHCIVSPTTVIQCIELSRPVIAMIHPSDHFIALYHSSGWYNAMYHIAIQPHNYSCPTLGRSPPNVTSKKRVETGIAEREDLLQDTPLYKSPLVVTNKILKLHPFSFFTLSLIIAKLRSYMPAEVQT